MQFDREIIEVFFLELEENLILAEDTVIAIESRPDDNALRQVLFRAIHNVKGSASSMGLEQMALLAHAIEDVLDGLRSGSLSVEASLISLVLESLDGLRAMAADVRATGSDNAGGSPALLQRLAEANERQNPRTGAAAALSPESSQQVAASALRRGRTLRVEVDKLDSTLDTLSEVTIALDRLFTLLKVLELPEEVRETQQGLARLHSSLQSQVISLRMVPVGPMLRGFVRMVRDVAGMLGKQARLVAEGAEVTIDANVIEQLREPLMHLVRNALDHGIELPGQRKDRGKDPCGRVTIRARREASTVLLQIEDDGAGLSRSRIIARARSHGLLGSESNPAPSAMTDDEVLNMIFVPGFSTAERVTELSGRGVGMDVVKGVVESLRGTVGIASQEGQGTTVSIRLPVTLALLDGFAVGLSEEVFVLPREAVLSCMVVPAGLDLSSASVLQLHGEALPVVRLRELLAAERPGLSENNLVVLNLNGVRLGVAVDTLYGETQAIIKPMSAVFRRARSVAGCTVLGSGRIALVLDVAGLFQEALRCRAARPVITYEARA